MSGDRYEGKPMLRLVEAYVLWVVGALSPEDAEQLRRLEPGLHQTFGTSGSWHEVVAAQMRFPAELPGRLRALWDAEVALAALAGEGPAPDFVPRVVDAYLVSAP